MAKQNIDCEKRLLLLMIFFGMLSVLLWGRFFFISIVRHEYYLGKAASKLILPNIFKRGNIYLTDKDELPYAAALNKDFAFVYAVPKSIKDPKTTAARLAPVLELDEKSLFEKISKPGDPYEVLKKKIPDELVQKIKDLNLDGIDIDHEILRFYPMNENFAQVLGFLGFNEKGISGQYGLEEYYNDLLSGDVRSNLVASGKQNIGDGADLILTVDSAIQTQAYSLIEEAVKHWSADSGSITVMDPKDGSILAMASYPSFNPNDYALIKEKSLFVNSVTRNLFEPGSVIKPLTMAAAIDTGAVTPDTKYYDAGEVKIGAKTIKNSTLKSYGWQTMTEVLEKSLNTGAVFVEQHISKETFLDYFTRFGIGEKTGIDLTETRGDIANLKTFRDINFATAAFGQGVSMTPIELLRALSAVANGGSLPTPHLVAKIAMPGDTINAKDSWPTERVISPETAAKLTGMLIKVVENGSGRYAKIPGFNVAGKTGTAEVANIGKAGYSDINIHSFMGFVPAYNPKFIALVKIDHPKGVKFSEVTAAPVFHDLASFILSYWQVPPDKPGSENSTATEQQNN